MAKRYILQFTTSSGVVYYPASEPGRPLPPTPDRSKAAIIHGQHAVALVVGSLINLAITSGNAEVQRIVDAVKIIDLDAELVGAA